MTSPPFVGNLTAASLFPLFQISSSSAQPCSSFCLTLLCFWPILLICFSVNIHFMKDILCFVGLLFLGFFERLGDEYCSVGGGISSACCHIYGSMYRLLLSCIYILYFMKQLFPLFYRSFINLVLKRQTEAVNGTIIS